MVAPKTSAIDAGWRLAGGTARGTAHERDDLPCQDSVAWWIRSPDSDGPIIAVGAVADGAGSAPLAELGSQTAVAEVIRLAQSFSTTESDDIADGVPETKRELDTEADVEPGAETPAEHLILALFAGARAALAEAAEGAGTRIRDLATTLMVALVTADTVVLAQVGDGVVAVRLESGTILGAAAPNRGEFANETTFITAGLELPEVSLAVFPISDANAFGLSSDGMRLLITSNSLEGTPYSPFFDEVFAGVASGVTSEAISRYLAQAEDRTGDDKSLLVGVRVE